MNYDMEKLYREVMTDHYKNPRNKGLKGNGNLMHKRNPSCGDDIEVEVILDGDKVKEVRHDGKGCLICCSSASVMCSVLEGKTVDEAKEISKNFFEMLKGEDVDLDLLDEASIYSGVSKFPARIKCAALPWHAFYDNVSGEDNE
ncbi:MAG: SUF system NifU family Fe-S cluster assembly protein [Bacilli bacterium]|nr:SUF system NifU family Fe-S cluster assembly protein [Bacilli bacterium]